MQAVAQASICSGRPPGSFSALVAAVLRIRCYRRLAVEVLLLLLAVDQQVPSIPGRAMEAVAAAVVVLLWGAWVAAILRAWMAVATGVEVCMEAMVALLLEERHTMGRQAAAVAG
jgi:hypothetical protein